MSQRLKILMPNILFLILSVDECTERVYPVGRLDKATTGVLLLTNDGDLAGKLTHPKYKRKKIYHVFLDNPVTKNDLFKLTEGIELDGRYMWLLMLYHMLILMIRARSELSFIRDKTG